MKDLTNIRRILEDMLKLLNYDCSRDWEKYFSKILHESYHITDVSELKEWARKIVHVYGGMCSFSDLNICVNKKPLKLESSRLYDLREKLFSEAMSLIESNQGKV